MSDNASIEIRPVISYPRTAAVGKSYVMTVDLCQASLEDRWPYEAEEYTIHLMLDSQPLFASEPIGDASVVLHRFGGTYGPATFLLVANKEEMQGNMRLTLVNESGLPVDVIEIPGIRVTAEEQKGSTKSVWVTRETTAVTSERPRSVYDPISDIGFKPIFDPPRGFSVRHALTEQNYQTIGQVVWSPDGKILAIPSKDLQLRDAETGRLLRTLKPEDLDNKLAGPVLFSPDGKLLAIHSSDHTIMLLQSETLIPLKTLIGHRSEISSLAWSPDSQTLVSVSTDSILRVWEVKTGNLLSESTTFQALTIAWSPSEDPRLAIGTSSGVGIARSLEQLGKLSTIPLLERYKGPVYKVAWSHDGHLLALGCADRTIRVFGEARSGSTMAVLEGHQHPVVNLSFSADGLLLASELADGVVKIWRCDNWEVVAQLDEHSVGTRVSNAVFHPTQSVLATVDNDKKLVRIWDVDIDVLLGAFRLPYNPYIYSTAKVVLLGDSGTGKSALAHRLISNSFKETAATHGCQISLLKSDTATQDGRTVTREIFLWDLAGQPNYRLLHPLQVQDAAVALILFDARHKTDLFASVRFWDSVVRQAQQHSNVTIKKILVATRADIGASPERRGIQLLMHELGIDTYVETSAKSRMGISELTESIEKLIDWERIPESFSPVTTKYIRDLVMSERESGTVMRTFDELYQSFLSSLSQKDYDSIMHHVNTEDKSEIRVYFDFDLGRLQDRGILMRLDNYILLRVELLDLYASAIINEVRTDRDGFGSIREEDVLRCRFAMPADERIDNKEQELVLLKSAVNAFLKNEVALRTNLQGDWLLVFPSLITQENTELSTRRDETVRFVFEGVVETIWAKLCTRLFQNDRFENNGMWRNAVSCVSPNGSVCAMVLHRLSSAHGKLNLYCDNLRDPGIKLGFEKFVHDQLLELAIPGTVSRRRRDVVVCLKCAERLPDELVQRRIEQGFDSVYCPVCGNRVSLPTQPLKIYVSSPFAGLQEYRQTVINVLRELGHETAFAEESNAVKSRSFDWMREAISKCDVYICLFAWYRGYVPDLKDGKSIVQVEYETARELNKPVLVFLRDPMSDPSQYESSRELEDLRQQLLEEELCDYFTTSKDLTEKVRSRVAQFSATKGSKSFLTQPNEPLDTVINLADPTLDFETILDQQQMLGILWQEVCSLPRRQRFALLLNFRDAQGHDLVSLLPYTRTATLEQIAEAIEIPLEEFLKLWNKLPLDDATIAELLGATRQQVINLRKSARERLERRMRAIAAKSSTRK